MNRIHFQLFILTFLLLTASLSAGTPPRITEPHRLNAASFRLSLLGTTSELRHDRAATISSLVDEDEFAVDYPSRSPFLAAGLSLVIPGAGEVYSQAYWRAILFAGLEAGLWYFTVSYNKKGDDQTDLFQRYADDNWSVVDYAEWLNKFAKTFKGGDQAVTITINPDKNLPPWERVDWVAMNKTESVIPEFSHRLPPYGDQQYYEMIGKYQQYNHGWNDADPTTAVYYTNVSPNFYFYANMRGDANRYYDHASTFAALIVVNHVLSAIDAAWGAAQFNDRYRLHTYITTERTPFGFDVVSRAHLQIRF